MTYLEQLLQNPNTWNTEILQGARKEYEEMKKELQLLKTKTSKVSTSRRKTAS